jgi:membrane protein YqaA with SNARE-associated domain
MRLAAHRHALWALAMISFIESSVFPIPPDILLIPMVLAARDQAFRIAAVCTVASVLGGLGGYGIGYFLYESIGQPLIAFYGYADKFSGLTPFPYKVITIASGVTALDPVVFTVASVVSRGIRFFLVAWLLWRFGAPIRVFIEKNLGILATVFFVLLLGSFVLVRYVF